MTSDGQALALRQLHSIIDASNSTVELRSEPRHKEVFVEIDIRVSTKGIRRYGGGPPIEDRENFEVWVPSGFPIDVPYLLASDFRFAGNPHVSGRLLCLYLNPASQWNPSDGMYGFLARTSQWLADAAEGRLDPEAAYVHPPVGTGIGYSQAQLVTVADIEPSPHRRLLWGNIDLRDRDRIDLTEFHRHPPRATEHVAAVAIANEPILDNYASTFGVLLTQLEQLGFSQRSVIKHLVETAGLNPTDSPLYVIVATMNRGQRTSRRHHLVTFDVSGQLANRLRELRAADASVELVDEALDELGQWTANDPLAWVTVYEARPSVTQRRDTGTAAAAFAGKNIEIWGLGGLGAWIAEYIARAKPARLALSDNSRVRPGHLVRQPYSETDITHPKATALADRLQRVDPTLDIRGHICDVTRLSSFDADTDLVIDATASRPVATSIELLHHGASHLPAITSVVFDARTQRGAVFASRPSLAAGPAYVARRAHLRLLHQPDNADLIDAFWAEPDPNDLLHPEPGCSAPTFHGSAADTAGLSAVLTNTIANFVTHDDAGRASFHRSPYATVESRPSVVTLHERPSLAIPSQDGYRVVISDTAHRTIVTALTRTFTEPHPPETGGSLFGARDDATRTITIDTASNAPRDSSHSPHEFVRGVDGLASTAQRIRDETAGESLYLGDWHTHPNGAAALSTTDLSAAHTLEQHNASVLLICAGSPTSVTWHAHLLHPNRRPSPQPVSSIVTAPAVPPGSKRRPRQPAGSDRCQAPMPPRAPLDPVPPGRRPIIVALSGGGFRATLSALGVLRLLADANLLQDIRIVSSVSGGSITNALLAASWPDAQHQPQFDQLVYEPTLRSITSASFTAELLRNSWRTAIPGATRTTVLERQLAQRFVGNTLLEELPPGCWFMFNATNLDQGVRFRFDRDVIGDYVIGSIATSGTGIRLATAVAASAAVPGPFPPLKLHQALPCATNSTVSLGDGGIYDNLALEAALRPRPELDNPIVVSLNAGAYLDDGNSGLIGRLPIVRRLQRANAILYRQSTALRSRRFMTELSSRSDRTGVLFNLSSIFRPENLTTDQAARLAEWRERNAEHDPASVRTIASYPTTFSRIDLTTAEAIAQRGYWLAGATLHCYQPGTLPYVPAWHT